MKPKANSTEASLKQIKITFEYKGKSYEIIDEQYRRLSSAVNKFLHYIYPKPTNIKYIYEKQDITRKQESFIGLIFDIKKPIIVKVTDVKSTKPQKKNNQIKTKEEPITEIIEDNESNDQIPKEFLICNTSNCNKITNSFCKQCKQFLCIKCINNKSHQNHHQIDFKNLSLEDFNKKVEDSATILSNTINAISIDNDTINRNVIKNDEHNMNIHFDKINERLNDFYTNEEGENKASDGIYAVQFLQKTFYEELESVNSEIYYNYSKKKRKISYEKILYYFQLISNKEDEWKESMNKYIPFTDYIPKQNKVNVFYEKIQSAMSEVYDMLNGKFAIEQKYPEFFKGLEMDIDGKVKEVINEREELKRKKEEEDIEKLKGIEEEKKKIADEEERKKKEEEEEVRKKEEEEKIRKRAEFEEQLIKRKKELERKKMEEELQRKAKEEEEEAKKKLEEQEKEKEQEQEKEKEQEPEQDQEKEKVVTKVESGQNPMEEEQSDNKNIESKKKTTDIKKKKKKKKNP